MSKFSPASILYTLQGATAHALAAVQDGSDWVLRSASMVAKKSLDDSLQYLRMNDGHSIAATLYDKNGNPIAMEVGTDDPSLYQNVKLKVNGTGSDDMLVNGGSTPVNFQLLADANKDIAVNAITFVMANNSMTFGADKFGSINELTNGVRISVTADGNEGVLSILKVNEDFVHAATPGGFDLVIANKDFIYCIISLGGAVILHAGSSDKVEVRVQDNVSSAGDYFKGSVKAVKEA